MVTAGNVVMDVKCYRVHIAELDSTKRDVVTVLKL